MSDRKAAFDMALKQIEKQFGKGSVMKLGEKTNRGISTTSTGSLALDAALGVGGYPRGRVIEIYGPESSGKTTVALHAIAEVQAAGGQAAFIDAEHALDPIYAKNWALILMNFFYHSRIRESRHLKLLKHLYEVEQLILLSLTQWPHLYRKQKLKGRWAIRILDYKPVLCHKRCANLSGAINKSKTNAVFINQIREKVGVMFGNPEVTPGGRALKFYSSVRIEVRRGEAIKQGTDIVGNKTRIRVVKNKVAPPFRTAKLILCMDKEFLEKGKSSTLVLKLKSFKKVDHGIHMKGSDLDRDGKFETIP